MGKSKDICLRVVAWFLIVLVAAAAGFVAFLPTIATRIDYPELTFDLSTNFTGNAAALVSNKTARIRFRVMRGDEGGLEMHAEGTLLDWPFSADADVRWRWRFLGVDAMGSADIRLDGSPWKAKVDFTASSLHEWNANVEMEPTRIDVLDPVTGLIVSRLDLGDIRNLAYGADISLKANARQTRELPVPKWSASARIRNCDVSFETGDIPIRINGFQTGAGASGIADHVDISPMFMHAKSVEGAGLSLSNAFASVRATEKTLLVTEAGAKFCGGDLKLYSFFLDPEKLNAGLTLYIDGLDAGETLRCFRGFTGEASGRLHGKLPVSLKDGSKVKLGKAYLFSVPGETGTIKIYDSDALIESLTAGGIPESQRENLVKVLANLSYTTLNIQLKPEERDSMALSFKVEGTSTHGETTVPVSFEITFHGDIEQLLNTGIKAGMLNKEGENHGIKGSGGGGSRNHRGGMHPGKD